jgi:hypothetical protein
MSHCLEGVCSRLRNLHKLIVESLQFPMIMRHLLAVVLDATVYESCTYFQRLPLRISLKY